ncbi:hypothetical protein ACFL6C_09535 [Myxococcota bacterium]
MMDWSATRESLTNQLDRIAGLRGDDKIEREGLKRLDPGARLVLKDMSVWEGESKYVKVAELRKAIVHKLFELQFGNEAVSKFGEQKTAPAFVEVAKRVGMELMSRHGIPQKVVDSPKVKQLLVEAEKLDPNDREKLQEIETTLDSNDVTMTAKTRLTLNEILLTRVKEKFTQRMRIIARKANERFEWSNAVVRRVQGGVYQVDGNAEHGQFKYPECLITRDGVVLIKYDKLFDPNNADYKPILDAVGLREKEGKDDIWRFREISSGKPVSTFEGFNRVKRLTFCLQVARSLGLEPFDAPGIPHPEVEKLDQALQKQNLVPVETTRGLRVLHLETKEVFDIVIPKSTQMQDFVDSITTTMQSRKQRTGN